MVLSKIKLTAWEKFSLISIPKCYEGYDENSSVCAHCSIATTDKVELIKKEQEIFGSSFAAFSLISCEEKQIKITADAKKFQALQANILEGKKEIEKIRNELAVKEKQLEQEMLLIKQQGEDVFKKLEILLSQKIERDKYLTEEAIPKTNAPAPTSDPPIIEKPGPIFDRVIPPVGNDNLVEEKANPIIEQAIHLDSKNTPYPDFTKMGRILLHNDLPGPGLRILPDDGVKNDIVAVEAIISTERKPFPARAYCPIDVIKQEGFFLHVIANFDKQTYLDKAKLNGQGFVLKLSNMTKQAK